MSTRFLSFRLALLYYAIAAAFLGEQVLQVLHAFPESIKELQIAAKHD